MASPSHGDQHPTLSRLAAIVGSSRQTVVDPVGLRLIVGRLQGCPHPLGGDGFLAYLDQHAMTSVEGLAKLLDMSPDDFRRHARRGQGVLLGLGLRPHGRSFDAKGRR